MKTQAISYIESLRDEILNISKYLYSNPEESYKEVKACSYLINLLKAHGFTVKEKFLDIDTSFYASIGNGYPKICFICEYDAIPNEGHITGHNAISSISIGAALGISKIIDDFEGTIVVLGCPGEYLGGATVTMCRQNVFDDMDAVLMAHPDVTTSESGTSSAILPLLIKYSYDSTLLSFMNKHNYSPLDAMVLTFNIINSIDKNFKDEVSVNGILSQGGVSPLIVPDNCEGKFYIRAKTMKDAENIQEKIKLISSTVSTLMNMKCDISIYEMPYENLLTNKTMSRLFAHNLKEHGIIEIKPPRDIYAGISLGDVSHICPTIHPYVSIIDDRHISYGTSDFAKQTISDHGNDVVITAAKALALTAIDLVENPVLLSEAKAELACINKKNN